MKGDEERGKLETDRSVGDAVMSKALKMRFEDLEMNQTDMEVTWSEYVSR